MLLGEFREKTKNLSDDVELMLVISEKIAGDVIMRDEIVAPVKALDFEKDIEGEDILAITDGEPGSYSL